MQHLTALQRKSAAVIWQGAVKRASRLAGLLARVVPLTVGSVSTGWVTASKRYATFVVAMSRKQGQRGLAIYLKAANLNLLRAAAGKRLLNPRDSGCAVSVSNRGLPRLIPAAHRRRIRDGDKAVLRFWLCLFTLYRVLDFRGKYSLKTIVNPGVVISSDLMRSWERFLNGPFTSFLEKEGVVSFFSPVEFLDEPPTGSGDALGSVGSQAFGRDVNKGTGEHILSLGVRRSVITKSGPNSKSGSVSVAEVVSDAAAWLGRPLFHKLMRFAELTGCPYIDNGPPWTVASNQLIETEKFRSEIRAGSRENPLGKGAPVPDGPLGRLGKLGVREEPGKMRLFAIVDAWTQWVMNPLHVALFAVLKIIPQDGTFNQVKPVKELVERLKTKGHKSVWSYDLSAATDRLPISLQVKLLAIFTSVEYAELWRDLLVERVYSFPSDLVKTFGMKELLKMKGVVSEGVMGNVGVKYAVGQPMGALSSWAMLAMTHHAIVQYAAYRAGWKVWFPDYAVLGDDVVIANGDVAHQYVLFMKEIGVDIGFHKSIVSDNLSLEFAKRFFFQGEEVTPFPLLGTAVGWLGIDFVPEVIRAAESLTGSRTSTFSIARYLGYGMKVASQAGNARLAKLARRVSGVLILVLHPGSVRGLSDLSRWWRAKSFSSSHVSTPMDRMNLISYVTRYVHESLVPSLEERMFRILSEFKLDLNISFPPQGEELDELEQWWSFVLKEELLQSFERTLDSIRERVWGIEQSEEPSDEDVISLLEVIEKVEVESTMIPMEVKSIKPKPNQAAVRERRPKKVKSWRKLHSFLSDARAHRPNQPIPD